MAAASGLPFIAALSLFAGRRGNASFCIFGCKWLLVFCLALAFSGPCWIALSYLREVLPYNAGLARMLAPLAEPAGLPWSSSLAAWLAACLAVFLAFAALGNVRFRDNIYSVRQVAIPLFFAFAASGLFFMALVLETWPFAGLPEGLEWDRALMAIWRRATGAYFLALSPAGAFALAAWPLWLGRLDANQAKVAIRWLAFWAMAGAMPFLLATAGPALGAALHNGIAVSTGQSALAASLGIYAIAVACWAFLLWKPRYFASLSLAAFCLLLLKTVVPLILASI